MRTKAINKEAQESLTPDDVLTDLLRGNERFVSNKLAEVAHLDLVTETITGQYPKAVILSCIDLEHHHLQSLQIISVLKMTTFLLNYYLIPSKFN